jgi:dTDP-4-amino-4,6-dideoxygalactose transaminase
MGRTALFVILKAIGLEEHDEVIIPAYICVVPNSVVKFKRRPIFY